MTELSVRISNILNFLINQHNVTPSELSRRTNLPQSTIDRLVHAKTPDPRTSTLEPIARYFGITVDQLIGNTPISSLQEQDGVSTKSGIMVPIIDWEHLINWQAVVNNIRPDNWFDWITTDISTHKKAFAVKLKGVAMSPLFTEGSILIVKPTCETQDRDFVIVNCKNEDVTYFRQLVIEGSTQYLRPFNSEYKTLMLEGSCEIVGVVIETRFLTKNIFTGYT